ncbi:MAG: cytochrome c [Ketobacter sp.]|nr:cytochrome c [Ketobacter sp.]
MRRDQDTIKIAFWVFGALFSSAVHAAPSEQRQADIIYTVKQDCGSCHGLTLAGGLGPDLRASRLKQLPDKYLISVIRNGVPGTPRPPWQRFFSDKEIHWIVTQLKQGAI